MADNELFRLLNAAQHRLDEGFADLPPAPAPPLGEQAAAILNEAATRLHDNYPYAHPLYAGQMLKPPHPIARAAYALAMSVNPNNHALDGGRASSAMEIEAVAALAKMFHWPQHLGHLSSGGTFANLEALWVAGQLAPGKSDRRLRSGPLHPQPHLQRPRPALRHHPLRQQRPHGPRRPRTPARDREYRHSSSHPRHHRHRLRRSARPDRALQQRYKFRIHVDAAYGGYFTLASNLSPETRAAFDAIPHADSIVVDPHKHGLQPYGCGCVLFRDPAVGRFYKHDSPYTYFSSKDLHLGEISLECSRAGASAVALWATQRLLPYTPGGAFAQGLESGRAAALELNQPPQRNRRTSSPPAPRPSSTSSSGPSAPQPQQTSSALAQRIFDEAARRDLHLALANLPVRFFPPNTWPDSEQTKTRYLPPFRPDEAGASPWFDQIWQRLEAAAAGRFRVNTPIRTNAR